MKTNSSNRKNILLKESIILGKLKTKTINKLAKLSGFIKRKGGKISPTSLIIGFLKMVSKQRNTYADWATEIGLLEMQTITKQSMNERMNEQTEVFIKQVVKQQLSDKLKSVKQKKQNGSVKEF
jgi:hypothetical protein